jgi:hypothetical protein
MTFTFKLSKRLARCKTTPPTAAATPRQAAGRPTFVRTSPDNQHDVATPTPVGLAVLVQRPS